MVSQPTNVHLQKGIALMEFTSKFVDTEVVPFTDRETGEEYSRLVCRNQFGTKTLVNMSSKNPELHKSNEEVASYIQANARNLQVVPTDEGTYILCSDGGNFKNGIKLPF